MWRHFIVCAIAVIFPCPPWAQAITVNSSAQGGPDAVALVNTIVDASSSYTVVSGSQNTKINVVVDFSSNPRGMGSFTNGVTAAGTLLPLVNQNTAGNAQYAGGIDIASGICLCTGLITDNDELVEGVAEGFGVGVEGPNNGQPVSTIGLAGEIDFILNRPGDEDFFNAVADGFDAAVLQFKITLSTPGKLRISFVHASDEFPVFALSTYNDTPLVFVGDENGQNLQNFILFRDGSGMDKTLSLADLDACDLLRGNLVAPSPEALPNPDDPELNHADVGTTLHFDHEFGGFTKKLTRERCDVLPPGTYTVKIVLQDVVDRNIDSATFFEAGSLKLYHFLRGDVDLDGQVGVADFNFVLNNFGLCGKSYGEGDLTGDGCVGVADFNEVLNNFGVTGGNRDLKFDFDRNNAVDGTDLLIWQRGLGLTSCASRFEGDADSDGDVDAADIPTSTPTDQLADPCSGGGQAMAAGGGSEELSSAGGAATEQSADIDQDGDVDRDDLVLFGKTIAAE